MSYTETHTLTFSKLSKRHLNVQAVATPNMEAVIASVSTKSLVVRGWSFEVGDFAEHATDVVNFQFLNTYTITVTWSRQDDKRPDKYELASLARTFATRANQPATGKWQLSEIDGEEYIPMNEGEYVKTEDMLEYADVKLPANTEWNAAFDHLYGLDAHSSRVRRALELAVMSGWEMREHVALMGPPGCGKSDIARTVKRLLGDEAVLEFDATNMTQAGAVKELLEREILPRVIIIEEIEKANEDTLRFLLGMLDQRAEIRKVTARANIQRDTKCFAIVTVNNVDTFNKLNAGALGSRIANQVTFKRPGRDVLARILEREITKIGGDYAWIAPALDYCESIDEFDPRRVMAVCLCGREMLLDGTYQEMLRATSPDATVTDLDI